LVTKATVSLFPPPEHDVTVRPMNMHKQISAARYNFMRHPWCYQFT
jgi:hypothetical protein